MYYEKPKLFTRIKDTEKVYKQNIIRNESSVTLLIFNRKCVLLDTGSCLAFNPEASFV